MKHRDDWLDVVTSWERSAFRFEQQLAYPVDAHSGDMDAWLAGAATPPSTTPWAEQIRPKITAGSVMARVRVFEDSPTPYQQWLRWWSAAHVAAGEDQRYVTRSAASAAGLTDAGDWWLIDDHTLVEFHYDHDLKLVAVEVVTDTARVDRARHWWAIARSLTSSEMAVV